MPFQISVLLPHCEEELGRLMIDTGGEVSTAEWLDEPPSFPRAGDRGHRADRGVPTRPGPGLQVPGPSLSDDLSRSLSILSDPPLLP